MRKPANAGPALRATLKIIEFKPMALVICSVGTASPTMAARDGCWNDCTIDMPKAVTKTCQGSMRPAKIKIATTT